MSNVASGFSSLKVRFIALFLAAFLVSTSIIVGFIAISIERLMVHMIHEELQANVMAMAAYLDARGDGDWRIDEDNGKLYRGQLLIDGNLALVDKISRITGSEVTIFKKNIRVATTIRLPDGSRAVGTKVSQKVEDITLVKGESFMGAADVAGKILESVYEPIKGADGKTIGMLYVGRDPAEHGAELSKLRFRISVLAGILLVLTVPAIWLLVSYTLAPLHRLIDWTRKISGGELNARFEGGTVIRGEVGEVSSSLKEMIVNIRQMILLIKQTGVRTQESAENLVSFSGQFAAGAQDQAAAAEQASAAMEEMAASAESVSDRVSTSVQSMEAINQSLMLLSKSNMEVRGSMQELTGLSRSASEKAKGGEEQIKAATEAMARIQSTASKITEFVGIITEISDRTNLLSLNAAIEAARAGDAGRGFAVVAQEITKLADRTLASAKEVTALIHASLDSIKKGTVQVDSVASNLGGIVQDVKKIDRFSETVMEKISLQTIDAQNISDNASGLVSTSSEIITSLAEQKRATREIETTIGNVSSTAQSVSSSTQELQGLAATLRESSEELLKTVARFQI
ncbi:MAG: methyl-accepting chemotaxis protein [Leptospirales bacterium]|nr:methyl-accepting chemotaxis protein [Leptospirales bacterium]